MWNGEINLGVSLKDFYDIKTISLENFSEESKLTGRGEIGVIIFS